MGRSGSVRAAEEFGPYLVYEQLGMGGMATVHRAETTGIVRRPVALKRMLPHVAANDDLVRSFVREARLASHLRHANVAQTYDLGKVDDIYFIAMELVVGRTLRDILRLCAKTNRRIPIPIALNILNQVCDALDYAHNLTDDSGQALGIIHRDVSPSNVIVAEGGVVKLIDFGIAKASAAGMQTMSGTIKGKFGYLAPEYLAGKIDARADLFALGVIAHEMLTGRPLFQGRDDMDTLYRVKQMKIESPRSSNPEIPEEVDSIVMTALERDPDARWQRAAAMRVALTTEIKRLGLTLIDQQVTQWTEAIFEDALGDVETPAPTRVLDDDASIVIERFHDPEPERAGTEPGHGNARSDADELLRTRARESSRPPARPSDPPTTGPPTTGPLTTGLAASNSQPLQRTLLGSLPAVPRRMPLPPPPMSGERTNLQMRRYVEPEVRPDPRPEAAPPPSSRRMGNWTILLLLFIAAAAAGAVVYFGLPYVQ